MSPIINFALVALGGALGSCLRYGAGQMGTISNTKGLGTFLVNVAGCFVIGALYSLAARWNFSEQIRLLLFAGLLGGFTTFSSFALDAVTMFQSGEVLKASGYLFATNIAGIAMAFIGAYAVNFIIKAIA